MPYIKELFFAPGIIEIKKYFTRRFGGVHLRKANYQKTPEKVQRNNARRSKEKLYRLIVTNFERDDFRIDLTYKGEEPEPEAAKKELQKFIRKLRALYKKYNLELKYIYVTEHKGHRIHHHLLLNFIPCKRKEIQKLWPHSLINLNNTRYYDGTPDDARRLAEYFVKETSESIRDEDAVQKVRWCGSKNLKQPIIHKHKIYSRSWKEHPKAKEGYQVTDLVNGWTVDGYPYQSYRLLNLEDDNVWPREGTNGRKGNHGVLYDVHHTNQKKDRAGTGNSPGLLHRTGRKKQRRESKGQGNRGTDARTDSKDKRRKQADQEEYTGQDQ